MTWKSANKKIATVKKGKITAKKAGKTTITAKVGSKTLKCKVTVENPSLSAKTLTLKEGDSGTLKLKNLKTKLKVTWSSGNKKVAAVKNGKVTAKSPGSTVITAKVLGKKFTCKVTVEKKALIDKMIQPGESFLSKLTEAEIRALFE